MSPGRISGPSTTPARKSGASRPSGGEPKEVSGSLVGVLRSPRAEVNRATSSTWWVPRRALRASGGKPFDEGCHRVVAWCSPCEQTLQVVPKPGRMRRPAAPLLLGAAGAGAGKGFALPAGVNPTPVKTPSPRPTPNLTPSPTTTRRSSPIQPQRPKVTSRPTTPQSTRSRRKAHHPSRNPTPRLRSPRVPSPKPTPPRSRGPLARAAAKRIPNRQPRPAPTRDGAPVTAPPSGARRPAPPAMRPCTGAGSPGRSSPRRRWTTPVSPIASCRSSSVRADSARSSLRR